MNLFLKLITFLSIFIISCSSEDKIEDSCIDESIIDEFNRKFCEKVDALKYGMPWDSEAFLTPLPEPSKPNYIQELIEDAKKHGAKIIADHLTTTIKNMDTTDPIRNNLLENNK